MAKGKQSKSAIELHGDYQCPNCGHDQYVVARELASTEYAGMTVTGQRYTKVIRHAVQCAKCQSSSVCMQWEFDASQWQESSALAAK